MSDLTLGQRRWTAVAGFAAVALLCIASLPSPARALETKAREAILVDASSGTVLLEKDADARVPPASMSKIMTAYMVFEAVKEGRLSLEDKLPVSEKAWRMGGSKMFVEVGDEIAVEDLIRGVVVQSGNDACIVLAEGLAGSEEAFAEAMNDTAREIGLHDSHFANATGWPDPNHRVTARDLATLAMRTIQDHPEFYHYYSELEFTWNDIRQGNRNPLLYKSIGADGLKTGHTEEAGYGLTGSAVQDDRRLILVIGGLESVRERSEESHRLIAWGFREFEKYTLFEPGEAVLEAAVWQGDSDTLPLVFPDGLSVTMTRKARKTMAVSVRYDSPIPAPVQEGDEVATLVVKAGDDQELTYPIKAGRSVERLGPIGRIFSSAMFYLLGAH